MMEKKYHFVPMFFGHGRRHYRPTLVTVQYVFGEFSFGQGFNMLINISRKLYFRECDVTEVMHLSISR